MYTDRTHNKPLFAAVRVMTLATILTGSMTPTFAQSVEPRRLSSNPTDLHDSFAPHSTYADSPKAFADYLSKNDVLLQRYSRHFGVSQDRVLSFVQNALVPMDLPRQETVTTFGVTKSGSIYPVRTTLPSGTRVWATREGAPVIKWNCSNPLTTALPGANLVTSPLEYANAPSNVLPEGFTPVLDVPQGMTMVASMSMPSDGGTLALSPPLPAADFAFAVPATDVVGSSSLPGVGDILERVGGSSINDYLPALLIPLVFAATQGKGGNADLVTAEAEPITARPTAEGTTQLPPIGPTVVPEGDTAGLLVAGLPLLGACLWLARRRRVS